MINKFIASSEDAFMDARRDEGENTFHFSLVNVSYVPRVVGNRIPHFFFHVFKLLSTRSLRLLFLYNSLTYFLAVYHTFAMFRFIKSVTFIHSKN